jgi:DNA-binding HxlR family transcriptional regulator
MKQIVYFCNGFTRGNSIPIGNLISMNIEKENLDQDACAAHHRAIRDTMDILAGKWKIRIIGSLSFGKKRFMELIENIEGIAAKMLSKELQDLEINGLVKRTVLDTKPVTVEYELTAYGHSLKPVIDEIASWGMHHRAKVINAINKREIVK